MLIGLVLAVYLAKRRGVGRYQALRFGILALFIALLGTNVSILVRGLLATGAISTSGILHAGGGFYYGLIPAVVFSWWYVKRTGLPGLKVLDAFSPSVALGLAIARIGCYAAGCCYGKPINLSSMLVAYAAVQPSAAARLSVPLHPTQLYESAAALLIFFVLFRLFRRDRVKGQVFASMLVLLAAARFIVELFRGDQVRGFVIEGWLSIPQLISLLLLATGLGLLLWLKRSDQRAKAKASGLP